MARTNNTIFELRRMSVSVLAKADAQPMQFDVQHA